MEAISDLMQVIQEMRVKMRRLEKENYTLRVKLASMSPTASGPGRELEDEKEEAMRGQSPEVLAGGIATDSTPAVQEQGNVMIVRRYSISSSVHSHAAKDPWKVRNRHPNILGASLAQSSTRHQDNEGNMLATDGSNSNSSSQRGSSDNNFLCREKTKTVSFQLPRDVSSVPKNSHPLKCSRDQNAEQKDHFKNYRHKSSSG